MPASASTGFDELSPGFDDPGLRPFRRRIHGGVALEKRLVFSRALDRSARLTCLVDGLQNDEYPFVVGRVAGQVGIENRNGLVGSARQGQRRAEPELDLIVLRPQRRGFLQDVERPIGILEPEEGITQQCVDERRIALGHERRAPGADRLAIASAGRIAGSKVERGDKKLGVELQRFAELDRRTFQIALRDRTSVV